MTWTEGARRLVGREAERLTAFLPARHARPREAVRRYHRHAPVYDVSTFVAEGVRDAAIRRLRPAAGEVVIDAGCGTGLNFSRLEAGIGPTGRLIGIELSPAMLARAAERVTVNGWRNVELINAPVEHARIPGQADAALFCLTHDILRSSAALEHVLAHLRPGGRVVAAGAKWAHWWALPVNLATWAMNRSYVTTFEGFDRPWSKLADLVPTLRVETLAAYADGAYVAWGTAT
jgi:ubiquinone/menaquinone biosynthesis C-methylase UbiE